MCKLVKPVYSLDFIRKMFTTRFSTRGCNERLNEERAYSFFIDYLDACENGIFIVYIHAWVISFLCS